MTFNFSKLFKLAHQIAKANRANFASYRDAFAASLKVAWQEARKSNDRVETTIANYGKIWQKDSRKRLYINRPVALLRDLCDAKIEYHRTGSYKSIEICGCEYSNRYGAKMIEAVRNSYFDLITREWHFDDEVADEIRDAIAA